MKAWRKDLFQVEASLQDISKVAAPEQGGDEI